MKTGRLELLIEETSGLQRAALNKDGKPIVCESFGWMECMMKGAKEQLKEGEKFVIKENW